MIIVGLPDAAVQESRERVQSAIKECRAVLPPQAPDRQPGARLGAQGRPRLRPAHRPGRADRHRPAARRMPWTAALVVGELSLDGSVRHVRGVLPMAATARQAGLQAHLRPPGRRRRSRPDPRPGGHPGRHRWRALYAHLTGVQPIPPQPPVTPEDLPVAAADRFRRGQGPGARQARPGGGRGRRAQRADDRPTRRRQDPAGARPARHPAAHDHRRSAGRDPHLLGRRPAARRTRR